MKYIYLAEPIDRAASHPRIARALATDMAESRISFYTPKGAWVLHPTDGHLPSVLSPVNNMALGGSAGVLAVLPRDVHSIGVPMEIERALGLGLPVAVWADWYQHQSGAMSGLPLFWTDNTKELLEWAARTTDEQSVAPTPPRLFPDSRDDHGEPSPSIPGFWRESLDFVSCVAPRPGHYGDAGYDLTAAERVVILPGEQAQVPCGIGVQMPEGYWALIQGRSSSWRRGLSVKASVIDWGYRGDLWIDCLNISTGAVVVRVGERIGQLIPMPLCPPITWTERTSLDESVRGDAGYGSTGQ